MAGRYVILEFEDRDAAQAFVMNQTLSGQLGYEPIAMYLKPKKYCECPEQKTRGVTRTGRNNIHNWRKHKKYGLHVCVTCGLPSRFYNRGILERLQYAFGYSILERGTHE